MRLTWVGHVLESFPGLDRGNQGSLCWVCCLGHLLTSAVRQGGTLSVSDMERDRASPREFLKRIKFGLFRLALY
jgi:hypothetical protein